MADTRRETSALQTLLADNTSGDISAQDARDVLVSGSPSFIHPTSAFASPPATPVTGDFWLPNNGFCAYRYSGSAWVPWGPKFPFAEPTLQTFAWINQGSATISTTNGGIVLSAPNATTNSLAIRKKTAPATPYTITAAFLANIDTSAGGAGYFGLCFRQSSDGKLHGFHFELISGASWVCALQSYKWTSATAFSASYLAVNQSPVQSSVFWLRIADNGTNRICSVSADGQTWTAFHTVGRTDFLTADEVGFMVNPVTAITNATLLSWAEG